MRYVVCNNFFGLESGARLPEGVRAGEREGSQEKPAEEEVRAVSSSAAAAGGEKGSEQSGTVVPELCKNQHVETIQADVVDQDQDLQTDHVCSEQSRDPPVDLTASAEQAAEDFIQNAGTRARDCHSLDLPITEKITAAFNVYDDEIWESPGCVL